MGQPQTEYSRPPDAESVVGMSRSTICKWANQGKLSIVAGCRLSAWFSFGDLKSIGEPVTKNCI